MKNVGSIITLHETSNQFPYKTFIHKNLWVRHHWHKEIEFIYVCEGELTFNVCSSNYELKKGDVAFALTGDSHGFTHSDDTRLVVQFDLDLLENKYYGSKDTHIIIDKLNCLARASTEWPEDVKNSVSEILMALKKNEEMSDHDTLYRIKVRKLLYLLIDLCLTKVPESDFRLKKSPLLDDKKVIDELDVVFNFVKDHYSDTIRLDDAAALLNYSPNYFTRFWKKHTGGTFHRYLTEHRVEQAVLLLENTNLPIWQICFKVGYQNQKTFNRAFKSITNKRPCDFRK